MAERMGTVTLSLCFNINTCCKCISNKGVLNPLKSDQHTFICHFSQQQTPSGRAVSRCAVTGQVLSPVYPQRQRGPGSCTLRPAMVTGTWATGRGGESLAGEEGGCSKCLSFAIGFGLEAKNGSDYKRWKSDMHGQKEIWK